MNNVIAVVVTYNRKKLCAECLQALLGQSVPITKIVLVNNACTDDTEGYLSELGFLKNPVVDYMVLPKNIGGAGGFYEGMKHARDSLAWDWCWIMDDDTIPNPDCLQAMLEGEAVIRAKDPNRKIAYLASEMYGVNGGFTNPTVPEQRNLWKSANGWFEFLDKGIVQIHDAAFTSVMFSRGAVEKCGLPMRDYFIWGDDYEYTLRLSTHYGPAYVVGASKAIHKREGDLVGWIDAATNPIRIRFVYYNARNYSINSMLYGGFRRGAMTTLKRLLTSYTTLRYVKGCSKWWYEVKGLIAAFMQYRKFKKFLLKELART